MRNKTMFHKVKSVTSIVPYKLNVQFSDGTTKQYDVSSLFETMPVFSYLKDNPEEFSAVSVDTGGYGIVWNDDIDLSSDELWDHGVQIKTPFDGLLAFSEASEIWNLNESTLRKAVSYGKLVISIDVCKFGKQWVVSRDAMKRAYGEPN